MNKVKLNYFLKIKKKDDKQQNITRPVIVYGKAVFWTKYIKNILNKCYFI